MSGFARSFKSPGYLSPCRRPGMPGRTFSGSSLASNNSGRSEDVGQDDGEGANSAPASPGLFGLDGSRASSPYPESHDAATADSRPSSRSSRPVAIEIPKITRFGSSPTITPVEPLSARGDRLGGYFPMHEDPKSRVHRPHPFHQERRAQTTANTRPEHGSMQTENNLAQAASNAAAQVNMPVASYLPPGFHDTPLPMGKYYPSNWEQRHKSPEATREGLARPGAHITSPSHVRSDSEVPTQTTAASGSRFRSDVDSKSGLQQYQRAMVAQAAMALGGSTKGGVKLGPGLSMRGMTISDLRLGNGTPHKPVAPRLLPLGSPGPITPMELDTNSAGGYMDIGKGPGPSKPVPVTAHAT